MHAYRTLSSFISTYMVTGAQPLGGKLEGDAYSMIRTAHVFRPCLVLLMACGIAMIPSELSLPILYLLERDGWELFGELVS